MPSLKELAALPPAQPTPPAPDGQVVSGSLADLAALPPVDDSPVQMTEVPKPGGATGSWSGATGEWEEPPPVSVSGEFGKGLVRGSGQLLETVGGSFPDMIGNTVAPAGYDAINAGNRAAVESTVRGLQAQGALPPTVPGADVGELAPVMAPDPNAPTMREAAAAVYAPLQENFAEDPRLANVSIKPTEIIGGPGTIREKIAKVASKSGETLPSQAPTVAAFAAGGPIAAGLIGGSLEAAGEYDAAIAEGKPHAQALRRAAIVGGGTSVLNALPFAAAMSKYLPAGKVGFALRVAAGAVTEGATETAEGGIPPIARLEKLPTSKEEAVKLWEDITGGIYDESEVFIPAMLTGGPGAVAAAVEGTNEKADAIEARRRPQQPEPPSDAPQTFTIPGVEPEPTSEVPPGVDEAASAAETAQEPAMPPVPTQRTMITDLPTERLAAMIETGQVTDEARRAVELELQRRDLAERFKEYGPQEPAALPAPAEQTQTGTLAELAALPPAEEAVAAPAAEPPALPTPEAPSVAPETPQAAVEPTSEQPPARSSKIGETLAKAAQNMAAIEGTAEPVIDEGMNRAFDNLTNQTEPNAGNKFPEESAPPSGPELDTKYYPVQEIPLDQIELSEEVPNFKEGANRKGVVDPLQGSYQRLGTPPVVLWRRNSGKLELITGRHRRDLAERSGEKSIPAQIVDEAAGFTRDHAAIFDAESNIRDGQGSTRDYATFFRETGLSRDQAQARGLLSRAKGQDGYALGHDATDDLYTSYRNRQIPESHAVAIATAAPGDQDVQRAAIRYSFKNKRHSREEIENFTRGLMRIRANASAAGVQEELFGEGENKAIMETAEQYANIASQQQRQIAEQIGVLNAAKKLDKDTAREMGITVNIDDPEAVETERDRLKELQQRWKAWDQDPEIFSQVEAIAAGVTDGLQNEGAAGTQQAFGGEELAGENVTNVTGTNAPPRKLSPDAQAVVDLYGGVDQAIEKLKKQRQEVLNSPGDSDVSATDALIAELEAGGEFDAGTQDDMFGQTDDLFDADPGVRPRRPRKKKVEADVKNPEVIIPDEPSGGRPWREGDDGGKPALMQLPELVRLAKDLMDGRIPLVKKSLGRRGIRGLFSPRPGESRIKLRADIFIGPQLAEEWNGGPFGQDDLETFAEAIAAILNIPREKIVVKTERARNGNYVARAYMEDPNYASRTLAHEIGHLIDFLPDEDLQRGNLLGKIASLKGYVLETMADTPENENSPITEEDKAAFMQEASKPEITWEDVVEVIEEQIGGKPITADDIKAIWNKIGGKDLNPALYAYITKLPEKDRKAIAKEAMKGIVREELKKFGEGSQVKKTVKVVGKRQVEKPPSEKDILRRFEELLKEEIQKRRLIEDAVIRDELKKLTIWWRPFDPTAVPDHFKAYRFKGEELYADALSVLLNHPLALEHKAPTFYKAFFAYMGNKPEVKALYESIQDDIQYGNAETRRREDIRAMFGRGEDVFRRKLRAKKPSLRERISEIGTMLQYHLVESRVFIPSTGDPRNDPRAHLSELQYLSSTMVQFQRDISENVTDRLSAFNLTETDLGEYMFYVRASTERKNMANPLGVGGPFAKATLARMKEELGEDRFFALEQSARAYRRIRRQYVLPLLRESKLFSKELIKLIEDNDSYATFKVLDHLEKSYGKGFTAKIYRQVGTLSDTMNPFVATVLQDMTLLRAATMNNAKLALVNTARVMGDALEVEEAESRWNANTRRLEFQEPKDPEKRLFLYTVNGKLQAKVVSKEIAEAYEQAPAQFSLAVKLLQYMMVPFRAIFTEYNPGFGLWNLQRDMRQFLKNLPENRPDRVAMYYVRTAKDAFVDAFFDESTELVKEMYRANVLIADLGYSAAEQMGEATEFERQQMRYLNRNTLNEERSVLWKIATAAPELIRRQNKFFERWSKVAAYSYLKKQGYFEREGLKAKERIRFDLGSPNFLAGGKERLLWNGLFMFANATIQGHRAGVRAFREQGKNYLFKIAMYDLAPKLLMFAASSGAIGALVGDDDDDDPWKQIFDAIPEHDKQHYQVIPLALSKSGKAVYISLPQDHVGQFMGSLLWTSLRQTKGLIPSEFAKAFASQSPIGPSQFNPGVQVVLDAATAMVGGNPYDYFGGDVALDRTAIDAGGMDLVRELAKYEWNNYLSTFYRFDDKSEKPEDIIERVGKMPAVGSLVRRFVRTSDKGIADAENRAIAVATKEVAPQMIRMGEDIRSAVRTDTKGKRPSATIRNETWDKAVEGGYVPEGYDKSAFKRRYNAWWYRLNGTDEEKLKARTSQAVRELMD